MKRIGLFVGVNAYGNGHDLLGARPDAENMNRLFGTCFDSTVLLTDEAARRNRILQALDDACDGLDAGDILLFFFSGHGCERDGSQILGLPGEREGELDGLSLGEIEFATRRPGIRRVFVFDCCRSVDPGGRAVSQNPYGLRMVAEYVKANGLMPPLVLSSCTSGESSCDDSHSAVGYFTRAFIRALRAKEVRCFRDFCKVLGERMKDFVLPVAQNPQVGDSFWADIQLLPHWRRSRGRLYGRVALSASSDGGRMALVGVDCRSAEHVRSESCARCCARMADAVRDFGEDVVSHDDIMADSAGQLGDDVYVNRMVRYDRSEGCLLSGYVHGGRIGVMLEIVCGKASTLKKDGFREVAHRLCLHVCSEAPRYVAVQDVPQDEISAVVEQGLFELRKKYGRQLPAQALVPVTRGMTYKHCEGVCLLEQPFLFDPECTVARYLEKAGRKLRDRIGVRRFVRIETGGWNEFIG